MATWGKAHVLVVVMILGGAGGLKATSPAQAAADMPTPAISITTTETISSGGLTIPAGRLTRERETKQGIYFRASGYVPLRSLGINLPNITGGIFVPFDSKKAPQLYWNGDFGARTYPAASLKFTVDPVAGGIAGIQPFPACESFVGQAVSARGFDEVSSVLTPIAGGKGEFETTSDYNARTAGSRSAAPGVLFIDVALDNLGVVYDADKAQFTVSADAFSFGHHVYVGVADAGSPIKQGALGTIDLVVSEADENEDTFVGTNSYGAQTQVVKVTRTSQVIYEGPGDGVLATVFGDIPVTKPIFTLGASPQQAQALKPALHGIAVVQPLPPYAFSGSPHTIQAGKLTDPRQITETDHVIIGDIRCMLLAKDGGVVVASRTTN